MGRSVQSNKNMAPGIGAASRLLHCPRPVLLMFGAALILSSCGDSTKRALGLARIAPDEFAVVKSAPLSQPPDFKLRPPRPEIGRAHV